MKLANWLPGSLLAACVGLTSLGCGSATRSGNASGKAEQTGTAQGCTVWSCRGGECGVTTIGWNHSAPCNSACYCERAGSGDDAVYFLHCDSGEPLTCEYCETPSRDICVDDGESNLCSELELESKAPHTCHVGPNRVIQPNLGM